MEINTYWDTHVVPEDQIHFIEIEEAKASYVYTKDKKKLLNGFGGLSLIYGGTPDEISSAINEQLMKLPYFPLYKSKSSLANELGKLLISITNDEFFGKILYSLSGTEAVEGAIKIANNFTEKKGILCFDKSYHGCSLYNISLNGIYNKSSREKYFENDDVSFITTPQCHICPYGKDISTCSLECQSSIKESLKKNNKYSVFLFEPVIAAGGVIEIPAKYLNCLMKLFRENGILCICDESATGFGRTGELFAYRRFDFIPDILILSKAINGGILPLGVSIIRKNIFNRLNKNNVNLIHGTSQAGNAVTIASAKASIEYFLENRIMEHVKKVSEYFSIKVRKMKKNTLIKSARLVGLMFCIEMMNKNYADHLFKELLSGGVIMHIKLNRLSFFPPLIITESDIDFFFTVLEFKLNKLIN